MPKVTHQVVRKLAAILSTDAKGYSRLTVDDEMATVETIKLIGRPKGSLGESRLDGKETEIKRYQSLGVNKTNIARI